MPGKPAQIRREKSSNPLAAFARSLIKLFRRNSSNDENVPWNTIHKAIRDTDDMLAVSSHSEKEFLTNLRTFYEGLVAQPDA